MLGMPYLLLATVGGLIYRSYRKQAARVGQPPLLPASGVPAAEPAP